jgi:hypothetical protein
MRITGKCHWGVGKGVWGWFSIANTPRKFLRYFSPNPNPSEISAVFFAKPEPLGNLKNIFQAETQSTSGFAHVKQIIFNFFSKSARVFVAFLRISIVYYVIY